MLEVFDKDGNTLFGTVLPVVPQDPSADNGSNNGFDFADGKYTRYSVTQPMELAASASCRLAPRAMSRSMTSAQPLLPFQNRPPGR